jgi:hypothetical protein
VAVTVALTHDPALPGVCSHDFGDNFASFGLTAPNYPATSLFVTSVGGTALEVNSSGARQAEYGWSSARSVLCQATVTNCGSALTLRGAPAGRLPLRARHRRVSGACCRAAGGAAVGGGRSARLWPCWAGGGLASR